MKIEDATADDIWTVARNMREHDFVEFSAVYPTDDRATLADMLVERYAGLGALCASHEGAPVAIGLIVEPRPRSVALGFLATDDFPKVALPLAKFIRKRLFPELIAKGDVHRIECTALEGYTEVHRWLGTLGMERESVARPNYGKRGESFVEFVWIKGPADA